MNKTRRSLHGGASGTLAAVLLVLAATSAGASSAVTIKNSQYGFSFSVPANWKQVPLNGSDVKALLNAATHDDPSLTNALDSEVISASSKGMKVLAIGPVQGLSSPNVNVIVTSAAGSPSGRAFAPAAIAQAKIEFAQVSATHVKTSIVSNRLGNVARVTYELSTKTSGTEYGAQYYARHKSNLEIVTITTSSQASTQSDSQLIVNSWRW
jgi:hypothetical protein